MQSFDRSDYNASNAYALAQIMVDTGMSETKAKELQAILIRYYGSDFGTFTEGMLPKETDIASAGLLKMPYYNGGKIYRGMDVKDDVADSYLKEWTVGKVVGFTPFQSGSNKHVGRWEEGMVGDFTLTSWSSQENVAKGFASWGTYGSGETSIVFALSGNKTVPGTQHISSFGYREAETLAPGGHIFRIDKVTVSYNSRGGRHILFEVTDMGIRKKDTKW